tara:strand:+ start:4731 stop:5492 length:762 start_codon:yes stop_codon:yes gene_type:complete
MKKIELVQQEHTVKVGDVCGDIEPNIVEDTMFMVDGEPIGFYISDLNNYSEKAVKFADIANKELRSENVPKSTMRRDSGGVDQYSTIIGSIVPKPHMRRPYPSISSVHNVKSAQTFIKAMLLLCRESEELIKKLTPSIYEKQKKVIEENVPEKWRLGRLFTSSISNFNIPAPFHRDNANLKNCVNVIIARKKNATGGNTTVPDYGATVNSCNNSILVYPAWRNVHGVTPIRPTFEGGYRNSLVFYPLSGFQKF